MYTFLLVWLFITQGCPEHWRHIKPLIFTRLGSLPSAGSIITGPRLSDNNLCLHLPMGQNATQNRAFWKGHCCSCSLFGNGGITILRSLGINAQSTDEFSSSYLVRAITLFFLGCWLTGLPMLPFFREPFRASSLCFSACGTDRREAKLGQQPGWSPYSYRNPDLIVAKSMVELIA